MQILNSNTIGSVILAGMTGPAPTPPPPSPPVVDFSASTTGPTAGNSVAFTDLSTNTPTAWQWLFPGGTPTGSTGQNPSVTYGSTGTYNVTLTASNAGGTGTLTKTNYITVVAGPVAPPVEQTFTTNGTWNCCPGAICVEVIAVGAGAGGRSTSRWLNMPNPGRFTGGPGGGAGEVVLCGLTGGIASSVCVIVGSGGAANSAGGASCFGSVVVAAGGAVGAAVVCASGAGSSTSAGGDGGGNSSNGGGTKACAADFGAVCYITQNKGENGQTIIGKPGGGGGGGGFSNCAFGYLGSGGAGGTGGTICGLTLGNGGAGGTNANDTCMPNVAGGAASGYGAGGGGAASVGGYISCPASNGGAGGNGVIKVIQYFA